MGSLYGLSIPLWDSWCCRVERGSLLNILGCWVGTTDWSCNWHIACNLWDCVSWLLRCDLIWTLHSLRNWCSSYLLISLSSHYRSWVEDWQFVGLWLLLLAGLLRVRSSRSSMSDVKKERGLVLSFISRLKVITRLHIWLISLSSSISSLIRQLWLLLLTGQVWLIDSQVRTLWCVKRLSSCTG